MFDVSERTYMMRLRWDREDIFSPPSYVPLKKRWAQLIKDT